MNWLKNNPVAAGVALLIAVFAIILLFNFWGKENLREEGNLRNQGAITERAQSQAEAINAVEKDRRPVAPAERNSVCSKYDRNAAANCP